MADLTELVVEIEAKLDDFNKSMDQVKNKLQKVEKQAETSGTNASKSIDNIGSSAGGLATALAGVVAVAATATAVVAGFAAIRGIQINAELENTHAAFKTLLKDGKKATKMIDDIRALAAKSPFDFGGLAQSAKLLMAMGVESKKVIPYMESIANAVAAVGGTTESLNRVSLAFAQMSAKGKISAEEILVDESRSLAIAA